MASFPFVVFWLVLSRLALGDSQTCTSRACVAAGVDEVAAVQTLAREHVERVGSTPAQDRKHNADEEEEDSELAEDTKAKGNFTKGNYTPDKHALVADYALRVVLNEGGNMKKILNAYRAKGKKKFTGGWCKFQPCHKSRGPEVDCSDGKCICRDNFFARRGKCATDTTELPTRNALKVQMRSGALEPDEITCPGGSGVRGSMQESLVKPFEIPANMSICRIGAQIYHGSPLPLVQQREGYPAVIENGKKDSINTLQGWYSVMTLRQWRTATIRAMSKNFVYSIAMPDVGEGMKRLGNVFHSLGDSFSGSHVARVTGTMCNKLLIVHAISMDASNFYVHVGPDMEEDDILFECAVKYSKVAIRIWARARLQGVTTVTDANKLVDEFVINVLCRALPIPEGEMDLPAGGAPLKFSKRWIFGALPSGVVVEEDAKNIVAGWEAALLELRENATTEEEKRPIPKDIFFPDRGIDACKDPSIAHVKEKEFSKAVNGELPNIFLPDPEG